MAGIVFCYPFGHYNQTASQVLEEVGFKLALTTNPGRVKPSMNPFTLPRVRMSRGQSLNGFMDMVR